MAAVNIATYWLIFMPLLLRFVNTKYYSYKVLRLTTEINPRAGAHLNS